MSKTTNKRAANHEDMKKSIAKIIKEELDSVYCDTCSSAELDYDNEENYCYMCHRKNINWGISDQAAKSMANKILNQVEIMNK